MHYGKDDLKWWQRWDAASIGIQLVYGYSYYMNAASVCVEYGVSFVVYLFNIENAEEKETGTTGRKHV